MNDQARFGPIVWLLVIATTCVLLVSLVHTLWLALPFVLGIVLYYILLGPMRRLIRAGLSQDAAALLVGGSFLVITVAVLLAFAWLSMPSASWQIRLAGYVAGGIAFIRNTVHLLEAQMPFLTNAHLGRLVDERLISLTDNFVQKNLPGLLMSVAVWLPSLVLSPFLAFFFLRDGGRFKRLVARAVPNAYFERALYLLHQIDQTARRYFEGLLRLTMVDTLTLALGLWMIDVSSPLLLGLVSALLAWVPFFGPITACIMIVVAASTDAPANPFIAYSAIAVFIACRMLNAFVFMPMTLGRSLQMHPLVTVIMIFIGGTLAGVPGLMLVLPLLGVVMVVGETLGSLATNPRLLARHRNAMTLRVNQASIGLMK